jgi:hypothetical protein
MIDSFRGGAYVPPSYGRRDAPLLGIKEPVAQSVEHVTFNHGVVGSNPTGLTNQFNDLHLLLA